MNSKIEIFEGHNSASYFWFKPVILNDSINISYDNVLELEDEFSIEENDVYTHLSFFLLKHFDQSNSYNQRRHEDSGLKITEFEWHLTHNFYTYDTVTEMIIDIQEAKKQLETDNNVFDFYNNFCKRINQMMLENPHASAISVMGP